MTKDQIEELKKYMLLDDSEKFDELLKEKSDEETLRNFIENAITRYQIEITRVYKRQSGDMEYKEYIDKLDNEDDKAFIKKFYLEYYGNAMYSVPKEYRLIQTEDIIKEANRHRNKYTKDILYRGIVDKNLISIDEHGENFATKLMNEELEPDDLTYIQTFSIYGFNEALNQVIKEASKEIDDDFDMRLTLIRFYLKIDKLVKAYKKEVRLHGKKEADKNEKIWTNEWNN